MVYAKQLLVSAAALALGFGPTACKSDLAGRGDAGGNASVVAAITGVADSDKTRADLAYALVCNGTAIAAAKAPAAGDTTVSFPAAGLKDNDLCALEIRATDAATAPAFANYKWYATSGGKPDVGLLYGSSQAPLAAGKLTLVLYRLYDVPTSGPTFDLKVRVQLTLDAGSLPAGAALIGYLSCGSDQMISSRAATTFDGGSYKLVLDFPGQDAAKFGGKTCATLALGVNATLGAYTGDTKDIVLAAVPANASVTFPTDLTKAETLSGTGCVNKPAGSCLDVRSVSLPWPKSFFLAKIQGKLADAPVTYWVTGGAINAGMSLYPNAALTTADLNAALAALATPAAGTLSLSWYKGDPALTAVFDPPSVALQQQAFDDAFVGAAPFHAAAVDPADLKGVVALHIAEVWAHGFHKLADAAALNALVATAAQPTVWLADVTTASGSAGAGEFLVTGSAKGFRSNAVPAPDSAGGGSYFDAAKIAADAANITVHADAASWGVYALKGGLMAPPGCADAVDAGFYLARLSQRTLAGVAAADAALDPCQVTLTFNPALFLPPAVVTPVFYVWGWFAVGGP